MMPDTSPSTEDPPAVQLTPADRMAFALCSAEAVGRWPCESPCGSCRIGAAAVAHEIALQLLERYGSSTTADWLAGVGCHLAQAQVARQAGPH